MPLSVMQEIPSAAIPPVRTARWRVAAEWALIVLLAAYMGAKTLPHAWHTANTDFPNYYVTARLLHAHINPARAYEWIWLQRQKDHLGVTQPFAQLVPLTPLSALVMWPLAGMGILAAKHAWVILNLLMLPCIAAMLRSMGRLPWRHIALIMTLNYALYRNLLYGQYYILLLLVMTLACWLYLRKWPFTAGIAIAIGFGLKLFPALFLIYFLRKKDWRAFFGGVVGCASVVTVSIAAFGLELHRMYLLQVLPWALRGEALDPYNFSASSIATLLHRLFIFEPQLNPHPAMAAPWLFAVLHPLSQTAVLAPALLLTVPKDRSRRQLQMEWAALLLAGLAISTLPASYHFVLLIIPLCFFWEALGGQKRHWAIVPVLLLAMLIASPALTAGTGQGWHALFAVPRLYALLLLCGISYALLWQRKNPQVLHDIIPWVVALACALLFGILSGLRHQRGLYADYGARIALPADVLMATNPAVQGGRVSFVGLVSRVSTLRDGYHVAALQNGAVKFRNNSSDELMQTAATDGWWVEQADKESSVLRVESGEEEIAQAESPVASSDGRWLAFLREDHGRARAWLHEVKNSGHEDFAVTPPEFDVMEMSFAPDGALVFSALSESGPRLYIHHTGGRVDALPFGEARYPAVSHDGNWLAYSRLEHGIWHLWLREMHGDKEKRLSEAGCNVMEPAWTEDSKTLVYASDCGRALWFTALYRLQVTP